MHAYREAELWWESPDPALLGTPPVRRVIGQRDANLANYLWDGGTVRIVDFEDSAVVDLADELGPIVEHLATRHLDLSPMVDRLVERFGVDQARFLAARRVWACTGCRGCFPVSRRRYAILQVRQSFKPAVF